MTLHHQPRLAGLHWPLASTSLSRPVSGFRLLGKEVPRVGIASRSCNGRSRNHLVR